MRIEKVAIVGAGAMGAAYAAMFHDAGGFSVCFAASGSRYDRLRKSTLMVNGRSYTIGVVHPARAAEPADLVLVALKDYHLKGALQDIRRLTGPHTVVLSVMNGLDSEQIIGAVCGMEKLVYAIAIGIDAVRQGAQHSFASPGRIVFGKSGGQPDIGDRLERLGDALQRAGIPYEISPEIMRALWWKFMINVGINQASAVLRAPYGVFQSLPDAAALMRMLMAEVIALASEAGIALSEADILAWEKVLVSLSPGGKTSMLQDIEAGRKTEVEIFAGKVASLGRKHDVPTPVNTAVGHIIRVLESSHPRSPST